MKNGDFYNHFMGKECFFICIALPVASTITIKHLQAAKYHDGIRDLNLYVDANKTMFIESDVPHVIYQTENHYNSEFVFAIEVDEFFGFVNSEGNIVRRFDKL